MIIKKFKYKLSSGCKIYHCGPTSRGKLKGYKYKDSLLSKILYKLLVIGIWAGVFFSVFLLYLALTLPNIEEITNSKRSPSITITDTNGSKITSINDMYGKTVDVENLPPHVWQAVIATEDKRFFSHGGIDLIGITRALVNNIFSSHSQGGSSITQQLAKNVFLSHKRSITRKLQEVMITFWLESKFTKEQILSLYLNRVSLVGGKYGISIASEALFKKPAEFLTIPEAAIIAGMLKAPSRLNPITNTKLSLDRMKVVLSLMKEQEFISEDEYNMAIKYQYIKPVNNFNQTRYFVDYIMDNLASISADITTDITIQTTLDKTIQNTIENIANKYIKENGKKYNFSQIAIIVLNTKGEILGLIGGKDYKQSQFNRATQMKRQPGSIFKPFVYLAAIEEGLKPTDMFVDEITQIEEWAPRNHDDKYIGAVSMQTALEKSLNTVPVQIAQAVGLKKISETAKKLGLVDKLNNDYSTILGTSETTLIDLTSAFATFANKGIGVIPHAIEKVLTPDETIVYERQGSGVGRIITQENTETMNSMLKNVIQTGTGMNAKIWGKDVFGKTGTSQNNRDAWFIGYTGDYITGIWVGNDDNTPMTDRSYGGTVPAKIFRSIMTEIIAN